MIQTLNISIKNTREVLVKLHVALPKVVYLLFIIYYSYVIHKHFISKDQSKTKNCVRTKMKQAQMFRTKSIFNPILY